MMSELGDVITDFLQSTHKTVEGMAFSPDSGVSSCSDSEPSSPVLSHSYTALTNADKEGSLSPDWPTPPWVSFMYPEYDHPDHLQSPTSFSSWSSPAEDAGRPWEHPAKQLQLPTCVSDQSTPYSVATAPPISIKEEWVETKAGFQVCHTGKSNAMVKLGGGLTYDIDMDIDIPGTFSSPVVKTEMVPDSTTSRQYVDNKCAYHEISKNNNSSSISDNDGSVYQDENCNNYFINNTSDYGMVQNHCAPYSYQDTYHLNVREETVPDVRRKRPSVTRTERLWEFILRLLGDPKYNPDLIEWMDRDDGTFRLNNSKGIAHMWGMRKNNVQMTYEKLSRALRYYYHRQILEPVLGKKLVYRFGPNATQVWEGLVYRPQGSR